jgi:DNA-binding XRE family transcriptional regulator
VSLGVHSGRRLAVLGVGSRVVIEAPFLAEAVDLQMEARRKAGLAPVRYGAAAYAKEVSNDLVAAQLVNHGVNVHHVAHYSCRLKIVKPHEAELVQGRGMAIMARMAIDDPGSARTVAAIAERLRRTRDALGLNQTTFAAGAGLALNTYNQYEKAVSRPELDKAQQLCDAYGLTLDWIYRGDPSGLPMRLATALLGKTA